MDVDMISTYRAARWRWLRRLQPNPVWDSLDLARLARHPLNDTSPETPPCNHHSNFSETETTFHAARHSSFLRWTEEEEERERSDLLPLRKARALCEGMSCNSRGDREGEKQTAENTKQQAVDVWAGFT